MAMKPMITTALIAPVRPPSNMLLTKLGNWATMPAIMMSETPLPMPRAVICSPIQSSSMVPPTRLMTAPMRNM